MNWLDRPRSFQWYAAYKPTVILIARFIIVINDMKILMVRYILCITSANPIHRDIYRDILSIVRQTARKPLSWIRDVYSCHHYTMIIPPIYQYLFQICIKTLLSKYIYHYNIAHMYILGEFVTNTYGTHTHTYIYIYILWWVVVYLISPG